jgi:hypothetical protein
LLQTILKNKSPMYHIFLSFTSILYCNPKLLLLPTNNYDTRELQHQNEKLQLELKTMPSRKRQSRNRIEVLSKKRVEWRILEKSVDL